MTRATVSNTLKFDPRDGNGLRGWLVTAAQFRDLDHNRAWMFNPWTGVPRDRADVVENPFMENIAPPFPPLDESCAQEGLPIDRDPRFDKTIVPIPGPITFAGAEPVDNVNRPAHYTQGGIECIDAIQAALTPDEFRGYLKGNALKYIWRERHKGQDESIRKAEWYIARMVRGAAERG